MRYRNTSAARNQDQRLIKIKISYIEVVEKKKTHVFLQSFNLPNVYLQGLSMAEGLLRLLLYCESGINKYDGQ